MRVEELRKSGWKIRIAHLRFVGNGKLMSRRDFEENHSQFDSWGNVVETRGGLTKVEVTSPDGNTVEANARCNHLDNYNRRLGVSIALGRAITRLKKMKDGTP